MYSFDSRIRYSEVDAKRRLTPASLINYFQDCCTFQSEDLGYGIDYVESVKRAWILSAWQIEIERFPLLGERVKIATIPYEIKGFLGLRNFYMEDEKGTVIARANSIWVYMDTENGRPARAPKEMVQAYGMSERIDMNYEGRKVFAPDTVRTLPEITVLNHQIDTNGHVNNEEYIQMALDVLPQDKDPGTVCHIRAEYKKSAMNTDRIVPCIGESEGRTYVDLRDRNGDAFATVEFGFHN